VLIQNESIGPFLIARKGLLTSFTKKEFQTQKDFCPLSCPLSGGVGKSDFPGLLAAASFAA